MEPIVKILEVAISQRNMKFCDIIESNIEKSSRSCVVKQTANNSSCNLFGDRKRQLHVPYVYACIVFYCTS